MKNRGIDIYLIPTSDFHESEYVGEYFKVRQFITGFTGSAGTAIVTLTESGLWTDGRYYVQAAKQLESEEVTLYRAGEEGVITPLEFIRKKLPEGGKLGFDGRVVNTAFAKQLESIVAEKQGSLAIKEDLVDIIWTDRPELPKNKIWILEEKYAGESTKSKVDRIRKEMSRQGARLHIISSLYDIAWILNIRGNDILHVPVVLSFLIISEKNIDLFLHEEVLDQETRNYLERNGVRIFEYETIYETMASLPPAVSILMDEHLVNYRIVKELNEKIQIVSDTNPSEKMKAIKNEIELQNTRVAHVKDGVAVTKFMYWLKTNIGKIPMTEYSAGLYLDQLRSEQEHFIDLSFENICAYGSNAAMMHYQAHEEQTAELRPEGFFLVDSGGHYCEGTTDITRTFVLGAVTEEQKKLFTATCIGNMNLANAKFLHGCTGLNLDILCRGELWKYGIDYRCGTGHGVGHILNVHEGPNGFRWKVVPERKDNGILEPGMITTDEPGVYVDGSFGIRIENELICKKDEKNEYGQFLSFENITYAPIDLDGIDVSLMSQAQREELNQYHRMVFEKVSPYLTEEETEWLKLYTRAI